jgi:hypothetical protein
LLSKGLGFSHIPQRWLRVSLHKPRRGSREIEKGETSLYESGSKTPWGNATGQGGGRGKPKGGNDSVRGKFKPWEMCAGRSQWTKNEWGRNLYGFSLLEVEKKYRKMGNAVWLFLFYHRLRSSTFRVRVVLYD